MLAVVGSGVVLGLRYSDAHKPPDIQYKTAPVEPRRIVGKVTASGTLQAVVTVQVGSQVSGRIQHLYADFNSPVKKGELVAKIDPQMFQAAVAQARANFLSAQASLAQARAKALDAERVFARAKALNEQSLASRAEVETAQSVARAGIDVALSSLEQAKAQLNLAQVNMSYTNILSPIDGVVISRSVDVGQTVAASLQAPVLFTIAEDLRQMRVNTNIAEGDVGRLKPNMATYFTVDAFPGQRFNGKISQIRNAPQTVQNVVTYDAVIDVDNADLKLRPGMTANATIIYDQRERALSIPNAALRWKPPPSLAGSGAPSRGSQKEREPSDSRTVWVLRDGTPVTVTVQTGLSDGTTTEIVSGLTAEDLVITDTLTTGAAAASGATPAGGMRRIF